MQYNTGAPVIRNIDAKLPYLVWQYAPDDALASSHGDFESILEHRAFLDLYSTAEVSDASKKELIFII